MRLFELNRPSSILAARRVLDTAGYDQIGDGANALVFAKYGSPFVLKLFNNTDTGFPWFVNYTKKIPSQHWPKFRSGLIRVTADYSAIRVERLTEVSESYSNELEDLLNELVWCVQQTMPDKTMLYDVKNAFPETFFEDVYKMLEAAEKSGHAIDLHSGNIMMRGDVMVVIDPLSTTG